MKSEIPVNCVPGELLARPGFLLGRLGMAIKGDTMEQFEIAGFSAYQYTVLALLDAGAQKTQAGIAEALDLDPSQLVGYLDGLEERGLVERRRDPSDRRRQMVSMTPAGKKQLQAFRAIVQDVEDKFLAPLDADERAQLHDLLLRVASAYDRRFQLPVETAAG